MLNALSLEALAAKFIAAHSDEADQRRILKGLQLAKREGQVAALSKDLFLVRSSSGDTWYQVSKGYCECADSQYRGVRCGHRWCLNLLHGTSALPAPAAFTRDAVPTVEVATSPDLDAAAERLFGPAPVTEAKPRGSDTPTVEIRAVEVDQEEAERRWAEWEGALSEIENRPPAPFGRSADLWRRADIRRRQEAQRAWLSAHMESQRRLKAEYVSSVCGTLAAE